MFAGEGASNESGVVENGDFRFIRSEFCWYRSVGPVGDIIFSHGVKYHQYADDTQLRLSMHADNTAEGLAVLAACKI